MESSSRTSPDEPDEPTRSAEYGEGQPGSSVSPSIPATQSQQAAEAHAAMKKEKHRVRFNSNAAETTQLPILHPPPVIQAERRPASPARLPLPRPSIMRAGSSGTVPTMQQLQDEALDKSEKLKSAAAAQERAKEIAQKVQRGSPTPSRDSLESHGDAAISEAGSFPHESGIPLQTLGSPFSHAYDDDNQLDHLQDSSQPLISEAQQLVRAHTRRYRDIPDDNDAHKNDNGEGSSQPMPNNINTYNGIDTPPAHDQYRDGILSLLLKLNKSGENGHHAFGHRRHRSTSSTGPHTPGSGSGATTPSRRKWYEQNRSQETLANLIEASARLANPNTGPSEQNNTDKKHGKKRPSHKRGTSASRLSAYLQREEDRITLDIAETLARQGYLIKLCRALMLFGAPTHRLEEYLKMAARALKIDGQFLYLPGCMIVSFDDSTTHTTEVRIVRVVQGIDLGKLKDVHHIYKEVMHYVIDANEGTARLEEVIARDNQFSAWLRVLIFGLTSVTCAPFSFKARLIDLPIIFCFGCVVGFLQLIVAPMSNMYSNVFEVSATILISFLARAFGSINNGNLFCFSALAQSGIVMLLPGYAVLCSSLELQSRAIVPGSVRIVYAIIYSLLLGFGITVGAALWGLFDNHATSAVTCDNSLHPYYGFIFVPFFIICISILYQARWGQMPIMIVIAFAGYIVNYFSGIRFSVSPQIANTLGAFCVGVLANLYSRIGHGVAAATLIPAIFVQVPGGLASTGGLLSGLRTANLLTNATMPDGTNPPPLDGGQLSTVVFDVAASMIQIAIGIAVGLFVSALVVYPLGKRRSELFSF